MSILDRAPLGFQWPVLDPFLFCAHHRDDYPRGDERQGPVASLDGRDLGQDFSGKDGWSMYHGRVVPGFPAHPHRGFETITIMYGGFIDHSDSLGATARFGTGDVQWLTAGRGIVHCEMFPLRSPTERNPVELLQIWLNLPRADKLVEPHFTMFWREKIPTVTVRDAAGRATEVRIVAGAFDGTQPLAPPPHSWAARPEAQLALWTMTMQPGATFALPAGPREVQRMLYAFRGGPLRVDGQEIAAAQALALTPDAPVALESGDAPAELVLMQARPIGEPVAAHGPFVMNTRAEIQAAFMDYQRTQFGGWPWAAPDPVHARETGRFARRGEGDVERP
jgi:redox-sensitive bicupin YhaK (pirin superfamily)